MLIVYVFDCVTGCVFMHSDVERGEEIYNMMVFYRLEVLDILVVVFEVRVEVFVVDCVWVYWVQGYMDLFRLWLFDWLMFEDRDVLFDFEPSSWLESITFIE